MDEPVEPGDPGTQAPNPAPPRLWPTLVTVLVVFPLAALVTMFTMLPVLMLTYGPEVITDQQLLEQRLLEIMATPIGLMVAFVPGQLVFLAAALIPAWLSPAPTLRRVALVRPQLPGWAYPLLLLATPSVSLFNLFVMPLFAEEPSEQIKSLYYVIHDAGSGEFVVLLLLLTVVPGFVEETFFRGFVQGRLLRRFTPFVAILTSTLVFSVAHMDLQHSISVLPVGLWCGILAWRTGSIWPAALCHGFNNLIGVVGTRLTPEAAFLEMETVFTPADLVIVVLSLVALALSAWVLATRTSPATGRPPT